MPAAGFQPQILADNAEPGGFEQANREWIARDGRKAFANNGLANIWASFFAVIISRSAPDSGPFFIAVFIEKCKLSPTNMLHRGR